MSQFQSDKIDFDWKKCCFLCSLVVDMQHKKRKNKRIRKVHCLGMKDTFIAQANERNDDWRREVFTRLQDCYDLVAAEAIYHVACSNKFCLKKKNKKRVPQVTRNKQDIFESFCMWFDENIENKPYTVRELYTKMCEGCENDTDTYDFKVFSKKLKNKYDEFLTISSGTGRSGDIVCMRRYNDFVLRSIKEKTKENIISAAARLIKADIKNMQLSCEKYPNEEDICSSEENNEWVPESLRAFMSNLISSSVKRLAINQMIVQAARPRSAINPIPFGIGVSLEKSFESRWLTTCLSRLGLSISVEEVLRFKQSAAVFCNENLSHTSPESFIQFIGDNVDHNIMTLTGHGTFHGMGMVAVHEDTKTPKERIPRLKTQNIAMSGSFSDIKILPYNKSSKQLQHGIIITPLKEIHVENSRNSFINMMWHFGWFFSSIERPRPNWSGFMQNATSSFAQFFAESNVKFLPLIDLNPNSMSCIYSTLKYIVDQAKKAQVNHTPCITFDQPLYKKAMEIVTAEKIPVVCRLGGFHQLMNFLSIRNMMKGSGLEEAFEEITCVSVRNA